MNPSAIPIEFDGQNSIGIRVIAYFRAFLVMAHLQFTGGGQRDNRHEAAAEEPLHDASVLPDIAVDFL